MVIEEKWFDEMNLADGTTFITPLIKGAKTGVNQKRKFPLDTKQHIREIAINNGWNTYNFRILYEIRDGDFLFKGKFLTRLPKPVELTHD